MSAFSRKELNELLLATFDGGTIGRAQSYTRPGGLMNPDVIPVPGGLDIAVEAPGSAAEPYDTHVTITRSDLGLECETQCTCPVEFGCKHAAAVLIRLMDDPEWFEESPAGRPPPPTLRDAAKQFLFGKLWPALSQAEAPPPRRSRLDAGLADWVNRLAAASAPPPPPAPAEPQRLVFILDLLYQRLKVDAAVCVPLKDGSWGAPRQVQMASLAQHGWSPGLGSAEDRQLVREVALTQTQSGAWQMFLEDQRGAELLARLVATGRCYWRKAGKTAQPLKLGEARNGELAWTTTDGGAQQPALAITPPPTETLLLDPPWYVDELRHECGPVTLGVPVAVAQAWVVAPAVSVAQAPLLAAALTTQVAVSVPKPVAVNITDVRDCVPVPRLTLSTRMLKAQSFGYYSWGKKTEPLEASFARLEFDYAGQRVSAFDPKNPLESLKPGELRRLFRDRATEQSAVAELEASELESASLVFPDRNLGKVVDDYTSSQPADWIRFVSEHVPRLRAAGWEIREEPGFRWRVAEAQEWIADAQPEGGGDGAFNDWFGVELGVVVDGEKHNLLPLLVEFLAREPKALSRERLAEASPNAVLPLHLPDGRVLLFPLARARQMLGVLLELFDTPSLTANGALRLSRLRALELTDAADWRWLGPTELRGLAQRLRDFQGIQPVPPPAGLKAELRPYQQAGLNWLQFLREYELAGVLADDMGLGKTVQTLAHLLVEKESGRADRPSLVVAPTSLMTNWRQEAAKFAPELRVLVLHGLDRKAHFERIPEHDLVLTTYPLLPRDLPQLLEHDFHCVILDEAQFIKNAKTTYAQAACQLKARHRLCLTGTPMENHLGELWSLFHFLLPGFLGDELNFNGRFRRPIEKHGDAERRGVLAKRVAPFLLRRRKEQVALELPPKTEITQSVELTGTQRDLYESVRLAMHARVREEVAKKGLARSRIIVLDALLKLRQICCHPQLLSLPAAKKVKDSAKLDLLLELLTTMLAEGRRVLLFSQFTSMLALIQAELAKREIRYVLLTGDTADRATPVEQFQRGEVPLFLISLKAGGTGLNLTAADTVIHYDPWWNPAVENQATDRAHRIGQDKQVFVYRLIAVGTVEEKIAALQVRKRELVDGLLNAEGTGKVELTGEDLDFLFSPEA